MWEKLSKMHIQNIIALVIVLTCSSICFISIFTPLTETAKDFIKDYFSMGMVGVIGWAFTQSKQKTVV